MRSTISSSGAAVIVALFVAGCVIPGPVKVVRYGVAAVSALTSTQVDPSKLPSIVRNPIRARKSDDPTGPRVPLGSSAPSFELADALGEVFRSDDFRSSPVLVVAFLSNGCPLVAHQRAGIARFVADYRSRGVVFAAINPNDPKRSPTDSLERIATGVAQGHYPFTYLIDPRQEAAKAFLASWTPDFYVFDSDRKLVYQGPFDDSRPGADVPVTGRHLREAVDALLARQPVPAVPSPEKGCDIAWGEGPPTAKAALP